MILKNEIYVDDILTGGYSLEEAKSKQTQIALNSDGFPMKKIIANESLMILALLKP